MTSHDGSRSRCFVVTSQGASATRWLSFVLAAHPNVFVAHGHFAIDSVANGTLQHEKSTSDESSLSMGNAARDLYEKHKIDEVFAAYHSLRSDADVYGNVHSYTLDGLMQGYSENPDDLAEFTLANLVRHPVSYIDSHVSLVSKAERYPAVYRGYACDVFPRALQEFPELFLVDCADLREFLAFATSCYSVLIVARDLAYEQIKHFRMESLTEDATALGEFCQTVTGLNYVREQLDSFVALGAINRHRRGSASTDPWAIYRAWPDWKKDIVSMMIPETTLARFENVGYEVGMLRDGVSKAEYERAPVPCLADSLKAMDENHPLLAALTGHAAEGRGAGYTSEPRLIESYCGYNIVQFQKKIFALSHSLGEVHVTDGVEALIERHGSEKVIVAGTIEKVRTRVLDLVKARKRANGAKARIMLRSLVERLAKLSRRISVSLSK